MLKKLKKQSEKWEGGAKKHGGLGNSMVAQVEKWAEPIAVQVEKIESGAEKHGGLGEAMVAQVHAWTAPSSRSSSQDESALRREAEELVARREAEETTQSNSAEIFTNQSWSIVNVSSSEDGSRVTIRLKLDEEQPGLIGDTVVEDEGVL